MRDVHRRIAQHIWDDVEADVASTNVRLVELPNTTIPPRHSDILEQDVERILD